VATRSKKWYRSRTVWTNLVMLIGAILASEAGIDLEPEETAAIITVINLILRLFTKQPLEL